MSLTDNKIGAWEDAIYDEPTRPAATAAEMKEKFDSNSNQLKAAFNNVIDLLVSAGGAAEIGSDTIGSLDGNTVHAQLLDLYSKIFSPGLLLDELPESGSPLANNARYRVTDEVGTYAFAWPDAPFEAWLRFATSDTPVITFPEGTRYIGGAPAFKASTTYEMSVTDDVVIYMEVLT